MLKDLLENIKIIIVTAIITLLFIIFIAQTAVTCGDSMNNTLKNGDILVIEKISKLYNGLDRYDVIVFDSHIDNHKYFIKRIIGLPGETVRIDTDGKIYINEQLLEGEIYGKERINDPGLARESITLKEDEYFVLGDNRNNSLDSRFEEVGPIHIDDIKGKAIFGLWPIQKIK